MIDVVLLTVASWLNDNDYVYEPSNKVYQWLVIFAALCSSLLLHDLADMLVDPHEIILKLGDEQVELPDIDRGALCNDCHEDVLADLDLLDEVLVIHDGYLEVAAGAQLGELILEVGVEDVDAAAQAGQEVLVDLRLELEVRV